jgi:ABC-type branched-subunit amino acid transport system substrate-binding protein
MSTVRAAGFALAFLVAAAAHAGAQAVAQAGPPADRGIREALRQYSSALENLDADAVKKIQPSIQVEALRKAFKEMKSLKVAIEDVRVLASDDAGARVSCRVTQTLTPKAGSKQTTAVTRVLRLRRQVGAWTIELFER